MFRAASTLPLRWLLVLLVPLALACEPVNDSGDGGRRRPGGNGTGTSDGGSDGGSDVDGGSDGGTDGGSDGGSDGGPSTRHSSFVPPGMRPETAARLIVLGDSISAGVGASRASRSYAALLAANDDATWGEESETDLESKFGPGVEYVNVSVSGATTANLSSQLTSLTNRLKPPVVGHSIAVMTVGGNDLQQAIYWSQPPAGSVLDNAIVNIAVVANHFQDEENYPDGVSLYVAAVYDPSDGAGVVPGCFGGRDLTEFSAALPVWRERYIELGELKDFAVVDVYRAFLGHGYNHYDENNPHYVADDPSLWFVNDCIHPNDRGHHEIRRLFFEAIDGAYVAD